MGYKHFGNNLEPPPDLSDVVDIAAGYYHNLALKSDGTVVSWGQNDWNQNLPQSFDDVVQIDAGYNFNIALRADAGEDCGELLGYTIFENGDSIATTTEFGYSVLDAEWDQEYCYNVMTRYSEGSSALSDTICTSLITPGFVLQIIL